MSSDRSAVPPSEAFDELARLVVSDHSLESVMTAIAGIGKRLLPAADEISVTFVRSGVAETVASTGALAELMDERQYADDAGPCLTAARDQTLVELADAGNATQYPLFAAAAREHGVGSSLSIPVRLPDPISGGLNLYSKALDGFAEPDVALARTLAAYAAVALANLHLYETQKQVADHLERALQSRAVIDQAKGVLMAQHRCSADEAFALLVKASQQTNRKLRDVAEELVFNVAGR
jgi:GAF domain-containing protein